MPPASVFDPRGVVLGVIAGLAVFAIRGDWRLAAVTAVGTVAVKVAAGPLVHRSEARRPEPDLPLPELTQREARIAFAIWRGLSDDEMAPHLGIPLEQVRTRVQRINRKWHTESRAGIRQRVIDVVGPAPHRKERLEWVGELGLGLAVLAIGITFLLAPADAPLIGPNREWLGLSVSAVGVLICVLSAIEYFRDRFPRG